MYILDIRKLDKQGRVVISGLFKETPKEVIITFNTKTNGIDILDAAKAPFKTPLVQKVDAKNRIVIPHWLRDEIRSTCSCQPINLCLAINDQNKPCLIVKNTKLF